MKPRSLSNGKCDRHLKTVEESIGRKDKNNNNNKSNNTQKIRGGAADIKNLHFKKKLDTSSDCEKWFEPRPVQYPFMSVQGRF